MAVLQETRGKERMRNCPSADRRHTKRHCAEKTLRESDETEAFLNCLLRGGDALLGKTAAPL